MTGNPPRRWDDDSPEEDFEAHRHREMDRLDAWAAEQPAKPLTDLLEEGGIERRPGETWQRHIVPAGWKDVQPPSPRCPWCQRPAASNTVCQDCTTAQAAKPDPPGITAWWQDAPPRVRRLYLNAVHGTDPWTGADCTIRFESVTVDEETGVSVSHVWRPVCPRTSFDLQQTG